MALIRDKQVHDTSARSMLLSHRKRFQGCDTAPHARQQRELGHFAAVAEVRALHCYVLVSASAQSSSGLVLTSSCGFKHLACGAARTRRFGRGTHRRVPCAFLMPACPLEFRVANTLRFGAFLLEKEALGADPASKFIQYTCNFCLQFLPCTPTPREVLSEEIHVFLCGCMWRRLQQIDMPIVCNLAARHLAWSMCPVEFILGRPALPPSGCGRPKLYIDFGLQRS